MLSISGHKLHAPKGIGVLYVRKGVPFTPYVIGGHQEDGHRAGTENVASIVGLGRACALAHEHLDAERTTVASLRDRLEEGLLAACPDTMVNGDRVNRLPNTTNISFGYVEGEAILMKLDAAGNLRFVGISLLVGIGRTKPCFAGHGRANGIYSRLNPVFVEPVHNG